VRLAGKRIFGNFLIWWWVLAGGIGLALDWWSVASAS
jgi:hypothetical protein